MNNKRKTSNTSSIVETGLIIIIFILLIYVFVSGHVRLAIVEGISMEPLLHTGDVVIIIPQKPDEIHPGDIVVYTTGQKYIIHRVIEIKKLDGEYCYIVKGDNNPYPDPGFPECYGKGIPYNAIVGVVEEIHSIPVKIPYIGGISILAKQ